MSDHLIRHMTSPTSSTSYQAFLSNDGSGAELAPAQYIQDSTGQDLTTTQSASNLTVAEVMVQALENLGVCCAFGVAGGAIAALWGSLSNSLLQVLNFRHETGAAFAAIEAYFASGCPVVVFTTTGPGIINALTGLFAARGEGAKVILLSAYTSAPQRGRWAIQETSGETVPHDGIFNPGPFFDYATVVESAAQLPQIFRKLALGLSQPGGFVAHISIPTAVQTCLYEQAPVVQNIYYPLLEPSAETIRKSAQLLSEGPFAIWVGFGAREAAQEIRQLAETTKAAVMCSPRGKGIFPEDHPQFVGVTGLGGHGSVLKYMKQQPPLHTLVLGTRLSEPTSFWSLDLVPVGGFIHVDIDPAVPGVAYPQAQTFAVQADVKVFVQALLKHHELLHNTAITVPLPHPEYSSVGSSIDSPVRPAILMAAIQKVIVEASNAIVLAESGNSFTWATHLLRFAQSNRYRVSTGVGAMGHAATGVVGAAMTHEGKAVAIVGDGAMLMNNEISTAVKYQIPAVWIILNDARYNMCHQGMGMLGLTGADATIPQTDFVAIAHGMGAKGIRVHKESELQAALEQAIAAEGPFVVDVLIDPDQPAPSKGRNRGLVSQGIQSTSKISVSFPNID